jgi:uncharacterized protein (TIGR03084 family)
VLQRAIHFRDESEALHRLIEPLDNVALARPTLFKGWTIDDVIGHLHFANHASDHSLSSADAFANWKAEMTRRRDALTLRKIQDEWLGERRGAALREEWRAFYLEMSERFGRADPRRRVEWFGPDMSVRSSITARRMETWAHGQAVYDLLGVERRDDDRIRNIAHLGVATFAWTFVNRGEEPPDPAPRVELVAPSGDVWLWNEENPKDRVEGSATEFCQVVTQTRNVLDTSLGMHDKVARRWMSIAQCFAGPPEEPPAPGIRHRAT